MIVLFADPALKALALAVAQKPWAIPAGCWTGSGKNSKS